jgi:hypothetical protein
MLVALPDRIDPAAAASVADNASDGYRHIAPHVPPRPPTIRRFTHASVSHRRRNPRP